MNENQKIKIDEILNSFDGIQSAAPQPFFYTRIIARLQQEQENIWGKAVRFISRPVVVISGVALIISLNLMILFVKEKQSSDNAAEAGIIPRFVTDNDYILASGSSFQYANLDSQ